MTIWFDAWKYESDPYLALVPLLKLIEEEIENNKNTTSWNKIKKGVERTVVSFIESSKFNMALSKFGSVDIDLEKFKKSLTAGGSVTIQGNTINYYSHPTEHLRRALEILGENEENETSKDFRIVVFIDALLHN